MALGDGKLFSDFVEQVGKEAHNYSTDQFNFVLITETFTSIDSDVVDPKLSDFTQVAIAGNYLGSTQIQNTTFTRVNNLLTLTGDNYSYNADLSNPVTAKSFLIYSETDANKAAVAVYDLTVDAGITPADTTEGFNYNINASGIMRETINV